MQIQQILITSSIFLYFVDFFGPYRSLKVLQAKIQEIILLTNTTYEDDGDIDLIRQRYERLSSFTYSEYLLTSGRESKDKLMHDAESEAYEFDD